MMKQENIKELVHKYINQAIEGNVEENEKFDFKTNWYKLDTEEGLYEFLKDTTAIVNTIGPDGFIVIGFNEKNKSLHDTKFMDSGLKDSNELIGIINKRVNRMFNIDYITTQVNKYNIGVLHIPPSLDKPHVIKNYKYFKKGNLTKEEEHRIFVRKGSTCRIATRYDLELMNYDKKNIEPEYRIFTSINQIEIRNVQEKDSDTMLTQLIVAGVIENTGIRPMAIKEIEAIVYIDLKWRKEIKFINAQKLRNFELTKKRNYVRLKHRNIIVKSNDMIEDAFKFEFSESLAISREGIRKIEKNLDKIKSIKLNFILNNEKIFISYPKLNF